MTNSLQCTFHVNANQEHLQLDFSDADSCPYTASRVGTYANGVAWHGGKARYSLSVRAISNNAAATLAGYVNLTVSVCDANQVLKRVFVNKVQVPLGGVLYHTFYLDFIHKPTDEAGVWIWVEPTTSAEFGPPGSCDVYPGGAALTIQPIE